MEPSQMEEVGNLVALSYEEDDSEIDIQSEIQYAEECAELEFAELTEEEESELLVSNLPLDVDDEKLATLFEQAGTVDFVQVSDHTDNQSLSYGNVTMLTVREAESAIEKFNGYDYDGKSLIVNKAFTVRSKPEEPLTSGPVIRCYIGNLAWEVDNTKLEEIFSKHGKVVSARVVCDRLSGQSRGFGFVTMSDETEMKDAIAVLKKLEGRDGTKLRVSVC